MLVIHDDQGKITQCLLQAVCSLGELSERYKEAGITHILHDGDPIDISIAYVENGVLKHKPEVAITGENRPVKADGVDTLTFHFEPGNLNVAVMFENKMIHREQVTDGQLEFTVAHAGSYKLLIDPQFPYRPFVLTLEAIS